MCAGNEKRLIQPLEDHGPVLSLSPDVAERGCEMSERTPALLMMRLDDADVRSPLKMPGRRGSVSENQARAGVVQLDRFAEEIR